MLTLRSGGHHHLHHRSRRLWCIAILVVMVAAASSAHAATLTKTGLGQGIPGFPSQPGGLGVFEFATPVPPPDAVREVGTAAVTVTADPGIPSEAPFAGSWNAYAVTDIRNHTDSGVPYPMVLQLAADAWAGEFLGDVPAKLTWLLRHADTLIGVEADPAAAAAAMQVVVWQSLQNPQGTPPLLPRADLITPTVDPAINALAAKFTAIMEAGLAAETAPAATLTLSAGPVSGCASTITVTGPVGVPVRLSVDNGGVLSSQVVLIGPAGTATATLQGVAGSTVGVAAALATGGVLVRADGAHDADAHTTEVNQSRAPEEFIFLAGAQLTRAATAITCPVPTPIPVDVQAQTTSQQVRGAATLGVLTLAKAAPPTGVAGRTLTYRLRVRNTSSVPVESVVVRDALPSGMSLVGRPAGASVKNGVVSWRIGTLAPGARRLIALTVRLDRTQVGQRCNSAQASAANAATVSARACSAIRAVAGAVRVPIVTG